MPDELQGIAYSYIRFSAKEQERGDSLRRQSEYRDAWLKRHPRVTLDTSLTLHDLGVSAFRGMHRDGDKYALGEFLRLVESGRIAPGSLLLIENLDRLSREEEEDAVALFLGLIRAGIIVVQLEPESVFRRGDGMLGIIRAVIELSRAHAESARKSVRVTEAWDEKKKAAVASGQVVTGRCPAWLEVKSGRFRVRPGADAVVRRMFQMCQAGYGCRAIAAALIKDGVPAWGKGRWEEAYVRKILQGRAVLGEYQPMKGRGGRGGKRTADPAQGPIPGYYPALVGEQEWLAAAAARKQRDKRGGRPTTSGEHVNVFQGLLKDAHTRKTLQVSGRLYRGQYYRVLIPSGYKRHGDACESFPLTTFERAVLLALREVNPAEVVGKTDGTDELLALSGELARVEASIAAITAELDQHGESPALFKRLREKEAAQRDLTPRVAAARRAAASPVSEAWGECRGLVAALDTAPDPRDARTRLRAILRRLITEIWVLVAARGQDRLAAVQIHFVGGACRVYHILHRPPHFNGSALRAGRWWATTGRGVGPADSLDLRTSEGVKATRYQLNLFDDPADDPRPPSDLYTGPTEPGTGPEGFVGGVNPEEVRRGLDRTKPTARKQKPPPKTGGGQAVQVRG